MSPWQKPHVTPLPWRPRTRQPTRPRATTQPESPRPRPTGRAAASRPACITQPSDIKTQECKCLLQRLGFNLVVAQAIVHNHGCDTAMKLSCLKPDNVGILMKTLCSPGGDHADGTKDPGIGMPHLVQCTLTSACFVLFHQVCCNLCPMINMIHN